MQNPEICIIAALALENRVIGKDGQIPWHISADLKRFRELTTPHPIIMGRKTFESIGKPLPRRTNMVVTRSFDLVIPEGCWIYRTIENAVYGAKKIDDQRIFIVGGGEIYRQTIDRADRLFLTLVEGNFEGDTFFPDYSEFSKVVSEEPGEEKGIKYRFVELEK